ncbi:MAG: hypothetical protein WCC21_12450 [Candidatus Acidiferrales bacterium]
MRARKIDVKNPTAVLVGGTPVVPVSAADRKRLDKKTKKHYETLRGRYPEVHGKKVDWISYWHEEGLSYFNVRFTDGNNFCVSCHAEIFTDTIDFSDMKTGDDVIIREYRKRRGE